MRHMEALRDRLMFGCGTAEPWFFDDEYLAVMGLAAAAAHWRRPLSIAEIGRMAPTPEVLQRPGRP